jgi:hypothetical protein
MSSGLIKAGYEYYEESKQTVEMSRDATEPADVEIMSADDVAPFWFVRLVGAQSYDQSKRTPVLSAQLQDGQPQAHLLQCDLLSN